MPHPRPASPVARFAAVAALRDDEEPYSIVIARVEALLEGRLPLSSFLLWLATTAAVNVQQQQASKGDLLHAVRRASAAFAAGDIDPDALYFRLASLLERQQVEAEVTY